MIEIVPSKRTFAEIRKNFVRRFTFHVRVEFRKGIEIDKKIAGNIDIVFRVRNTLVVAFSNSDIGAENSTVFRSDEDRIIASVDVASRTPFA